MDAFLGLGLSEPLATALSSLGYSLPTPIQEAAIPLLLSGRDVLVESETGTGKTFAYLAPALELAAFGKRPPKPAPEGGAEGGAAADDAAPAAPAATAAAAAAAAAAAVREAAPAWRAPLGRGASAGREGPEVLVVAPTQELAVQIGRETERLVEASGLGLKVAVILGGTPLSKQEAKLQARPAVVVGTLGRLGDLVALRRIRLSALKLLVLDEADRLLAPEAEEQTTKLLSALPRAAARVLVSATLPARVRAKAAPFLTEPALASASAGPVLAGDIEHWCFYCDGRKRLDFLRRLEAAIRPPRCLVFIAQAHRVPHAVERLEAMGLPVAGIHARLEKEERRVALERFAKGELRYLVTSDLGARGLDIAGLSHVVSLDLPEEPTVYVHRAGRTGRAGAKGVSIVLADSVELERASRMAVRAGFVFRCKFLEAGEVLEPTTVEFFERAERADAEKQSHRAERSLRGPGAREARPASSGRPEASRPRQERPYPDRSGAERRRPAPGAERPAAPRTSPGRPSSSRPAPAGAESARPNAARPEARREEPREAPRGTPRPAPREIRRATPSHGKGPQRPKSLRPGAPGWTQADEDGRSRDAEPGRGKGRR